MNRDDDGIVAVGMSGGVDSTMAALLLARAGRRVVGLTMSVWDGSIPLPDKGRSGCFGPGEVRELEAVRAIAGRIGIPHHVIPLAADYRRGVLDYFCGEYRGGRTPNPCVVCNCRIKFGLLPERAREAGIEFARFASGHYARIARGAGGGKSRLLRGVDRTKDQSYFLAFLDQAQLEDLVFPLGGLRKGTVLAMAREAGFGDLADRPESQDFIESDDYMPLFDDADRRSGPIVDEAGNLLGRHRGIIRYTVGQRAGLGVSAATRLYVKELRAATNTVVLAPREALFSRFLLIERAHWIAGTPTDGSRVVLRPRYRHPGAAARIEAVGEATWKAVFDEPLFAAAPGQAAVCYDGEECLGGGWIAGAGDSRSREAQ